MLADLNLMIKAFNDLHLVNDNVEPTFMQLTDYPHLENVCSNVLAFFFDMEEAHGLGGLFIRSLLECAGAQTNCRYTETVEREVLTAKRNRIDIFIETDKHLIAVENKVLSRLNNPLSDYEAHIHKLNGASEKEQIFVLLTLKEESAGDSAFVNVTYSKFFAVIRKNLGTYIVTANTKWIVILNDFIRTTDELQGGAVLDRGFIEFYNENEAAIDALLKARKALPQTLKAKLQAVMGWVSVDDSLAEGEFTVDHSDFHAEYYLTNNNIRQIGAPVHCLIYADTKVCDIMLGIDGATNSQKKTLQKLLLERKLVCSPWEGNSDYFRVKSLSLFEADEVIAKELQHVLSSLV